MNEPNGNEIKRSLTPPTVFVLAKKGQEGHCSCKMAFYACTNEVEQRQRKMQAIVPPPTP